MPDTTFTASYVLTDAILETYLANDPRTEAVAMVALSAAVQGWYCQRATKAIDALPLSGHKLLETQSLQFPRKYVSQGLPSPYFGSLILIDQLGYVYESADVPQVVINACGEEALGIYRRINSQRLQNIQEGVANQSISGASETYAPNAKNQYEGLMSKDAYDMLLKYIDPSAPML
jgi:hypothetical protein